MARTRAHSADDDGDDRLYRAPALEKGLDIMELLATEQRPLSVSAIVQKLGRSTGELFRMIQVLEHRGFVMQDSDGYSLTSKVFEMGLERPPVRNLVEIALPVMRRLSNDIGQSCHLVFASNDQMVVVARIESPGQLGFSVRVGFRRPLHLTSSGAVLYAFQPADVRAQWETWFDPKPNRAALAAFRKHCDVIREHGHVQQASSFTAGITDLSAPILRRNLAAAALTVPFVLSLGEQMPMNEVARHLIDATTEISSGLIQNDGRI